MTPTEIRDLVAGRFPVLMYEGYRPGTDPDTDPESGDVILWPKELKYVLTSYGNKAGIRKTLYVEGEDIDPIEFTIDLPVDYRALESCQDNQGRYIRTKDGTRTEGAETIRTVKFYPKFGWDYVYYPIKFSYFIKLAACIDNDDELPEQCDTDLICDYLEAVIGEINYQYLAAMEMNDTFEAKQKEITEYIQQRQRCEERIANLKVLPSAIATC